jgi:putative flavoprotein involved in K+ transport
MQLVGSPGRTLDLNALGGIGVRLVGRFVGVSDGLARFSGSLPNVTALADLKLGRLLDTLDAWAERAGIDAGPPRRFPPSVVPDPGPLSARLGPGGIESIVWASGYRPDLSFLDVDVFDRRGRVVHDGGVTASPGLYLMGLPLLRRRRSTLIDGAAGDARDLAKHLVGHLDTTARRRAG